MGDESILQWAKSLQNQNDPASEAIKDLLWQVAQIPPAQETTPPATLDDVLAQSDDIYPNLQVGVWAYDRVADRVYRFTFRGPDEKPWYTLTSGNGLARHVIETNAPFQNPRVAESRFVHGRFSCTCGIKGYLGMPILGAGGLPIGVICFYSQDAVCFSMEQMKIAEQIARQVAWWIRKAEQEGQKRAAEC